MCRDITVLSGRVENELETEHSRSHLAPAERAAIGEYLLSDVNQ
jgi:hypothetical protein